VFWPYRGRASNVQVSVLFPQPGNHIVQIRLLRLHSVFLYSFLHTGQIYSYKVNAHGNVFHTNLLITLNILLKDCRFIVVCAPQWPGQLCWRERTFLVVSTVTAGYSIVPGPIGWVLGVGQRAATGKTHCYETSQSVVKITKASLTTATNFVNRTSTLKNKILYFSSAVAL
jgi:hypothetical protein